MRQTPVHRRRLRLRGATAPPGRPSPARPPSASSCRRSESVARSPRPALQKAQDKGSTPPGAGFHGCMAVPSRPSPCSAHRPVLKKYPFGLQLIADAIGLDEVAVFLGFGTCCDPAFDVAGIALATEPLVGIHSQKPKQAGRRLD